MPVLHVFDSVRFWWGIPTGLVSAEFKNWKIFRLFFSFFFTPKRRVLRGLRRELPRRAVQDQIEPALRPLEGPQQQVG